MKWDDACQWSKVRMKKDVATAYFNPYITGFSFLHMLYHLGANPAPCNVVYMFNAKELKHYYMSGGTKKSYDSLNEDSRPLVPSQNWQES
jgi:hypothetical protein